MNGMYCLMNRGIPLGDDSRNQLIVAAQTMYREGKDRMKVSSHEFEGQIVTDWQTKGVGSFFGIAFTAKISTAVGEIDVDYIVSMKKKFEGNDYKWVDNVRIPNIDVDPSLN